jgi:hypothetical protein
MATTAPPSGTHAGILRLARNDAAHMPKSLTTESELTAAAAQADAASATATASAQPRLTALARRRVLTMGMVLAMNVASSPSLTVASLCIVFLQVRALRARCARAGCGLRGWREAASCKNPQPQKKPESGTRPPGPPPPPACQYLR